MSILVNHQTRLLVQGITGREGGFHTRQCLDYGTRVVAGVTPGRGGEKFGDIPVYDTVRRAVEDTGANCSMIMVPPPFAADAILEAVAAELPLIIAVTEGIPTLDMLKIINLLKSSASRLIGPNCPGIISPGQCKVGIMPGSIHLAGGPIGVVSRSGTLTYEIVQQLTARNIGQTSCVGIGGDPFIGTSFIDCLREFENDPETSGVVMVGEIGGNAEEEAALYAMNEMSKPVVGFIAGRTAPPGKRMGHAGAIISGSAGTADGKIRSLRQKGIQVCEDLGELGEFCEEIFFPG